MNSQIRRLAKQSGATLNEGFDGKKDFVYGITMSPEELEKFAELIVLECVNAVMDGTKEGDHYAMRIENHFDNGTGGVLHFGVEE